MLGLSFQCFSFILNVEKRILATKIPIYITELSEVEIFCSYVYVHRFFNQKLGLNRHSLGGLGI